MELNNKISAEHLKRKAYLYVRQSTIQQVINNTESTRRQYELKDQAVVLGWPRERIEVIDSDLATSATSMSARQGFQKLVSEVSLGKAGIVMGIEVSRLARNNADWHKLLEICGVQNTLVFDQDGIYDPKKYNDRLLLGLKGAMSEAETHMIRSRLRGGIISMAKRGELRVKPPVGLIYDNENKLVLHPDKQVQESFRLLYKTFFRVKTAHGTAKYFRDNGILFPHKDLRGTNDDINITWTPLLVRKVLLILHNPRYAGVYVYDRKYWKKDSGERNWWEIPTKERWRIFIPDAHPGYISLSQYEQIDDMLLKNALAYGIDRHHGPPREGPALLQGRVICGVCGNRMTVRYHQRGEQLVPDYFCNRNRMEHGDPTCQVITGKVVDETVGKLLKEAMTPMAIEVSLEVEKKVQARFDEADRLRYQQVERARYEAKKAKERYMLVDPANRLVADTLEKKWNEKLYALRKAQDDYEQQHKEAQKTLDEAKQKKIFSLSKSFPAIWDNEKTSSRERKRMLALLIEDVTLIRSEKIIIQVRFKGGSTTIVKIPLPLNAWQGLKTPAHIVSLIEKLSSQHNDAEIASQLTERGCVTGGGRKFDKAGVQWVRYSNNIKSYKDCLKDKGLISFKEICERYGVRYSTVKHLRKKGLLSAIKCNHKGDWLYYPPSDNDKAFHDKIKSIKMRKNHKNK